MTVKRVIDRDDFARYAGEPYTGNEYNPGACDCDDITESNIRFNFREFFDTFGGIEDPWLSEWDYRRRHNLPFIYTECNGYFEIEVRLMSAGEFYDLLIEMKKEKDSDIAKVRYL